MSGVDPSRERPSLHGKILGEALSDLAKAGACGTDLLSAMCGTCAFREGCMTNMMAATGKDALNCAIGVDQSEFGCHHGLRDGEPTKPCAGWVAARRAPFELMKSTLRTMRARLVKLPEQDRVRADFDAWVASFDPDWRMDNYQWARAYARRDSDGSDETGDTLARGEQP